MNQSVLLNNDLAFNETKDVWQLTGFYQSQSIVIYISGKKLAKNTQITTEHVFDLEADIEEWLEDNEPDNNNEIWL